MRTLVLTVLVAGPGAFGESGATQPDAPNKPDESAPAPVAIDVRRDDLDKHWKITYCFEHEVEGMEFMRDSSFRADQWQIDGQGAQWGMRRDKEIVRLKPGVQRREISFLVPEFTEQRVKGYEFFIPFSDGSLILYTGYLDARPLTADQSESDKSVWPQHFRFHAAPQGHIVLKGELYQNNAAWVDAGDNGTYVYFGSIRPVVTLNMIGIFDPGLPNWLATGARALIPRVFDYYAEQTGIVLDVKPTVFFSFQDVEISGLVSSGGTLTGVIQMHAKGSNWKRADPQSAEELYYLAAHEGAHMWNGEMVQYQNDSESWMHEGGADAFTFFALREFEILDDDGLMEHFTGSLNECLMGLEGISLNESVDQRRFRNYYTCGAVMALWTQAALQQVNTHLSIFDFWSELIGQAQENGGKYDQALYFQTLRSMGANSEAIAAMRTFTEEPIGDIARFITENLQKAAIIVELNPENATLKYRSSQGQQALRLLMAYNCDGGYSVRQETEYFQTGALSNCDPFAKTLMVTALGGHKIMAEGDRAYDYLRTQCGRRRAALVDVKDSDEPLAIACATEIPSRIPWLQLGAHRAEMPAGGGSSTS